MTLRAPPSLGVRVDLLRPLSSNAPLASSPGGPWSAPWTILSHSTPQSSLTKGWPHVSTRSGAHLGAQTPVVKGAPSRAVGSTTRTHGHLLLGKRPGRDWGLCYNSRRGRPPWGRGGSSHSCFDLSSKRNNTHDSASSTFPPLRLPPSPTRIRTQRVVASTVGGEGRERKGYFSFTDTALNSNHQMRNQGSNGFILRLKQLALHVWV